MSKIINKEGDHFHPTKSGRGVDISSQRQDELDAASIQFIMNEMKSGPVNAVDLGGGFGIHSIAMASAGASVVMIDMDDGEAQKNIAQADSVTRSRIKIIKSDFRKIDETDIPDKLSVLYSQRAIHYIRYHEALSLLGLLFNKMASGGRVFMSAAGYDTEYGKTCPDRDKPVTDRFACVTEDMQAKHGILHPIVTYSEAELGTLLESAGFEIEKITRSEFGNIKAIACKP